MQVLTGTELQGYTKAELLTHCAQMDVAVGELLVTLEAGRKAWAAERARVRELEAEMAKLMDEVKTEWGHTMARKLWAKRTGSHPSPSTVRRRAARVIVNTKG